MRLHCPGHRVECRTCHRNDVEVIKECQQLVGWIEVACCPCESTVLPQDKYRGGQRVALLTALGLVDITPAAGRVPPAKGGGATIEHAHERQQFWRHFLQLDQEGCLRPSSETTTTSSRESSAARTVAAMASVPARDWSAYWCGRVAWSRVVPHCFARARATPVATPRTPPSSF